VGGANGGDDEGAGDAGDADAEGVVTWLAGGRLGDVGADRLGPGSELAQIPKASCPVGVGPAALGRRLHALQAGCQVRWP